MSTKVETSHLTKNILPGAVQLRAKRTGRLGVTMALSAAIAGASIGLTPISANAAAPARQTAMAPVTYMPSAMPGTALPMGSWIWYGFKLNWWETNRIANLSLWNAVAGVKGVNLIPYSSTIMAIYAVNWVLTARNARSMGQCLAISYAGTGLIVRC